jgi:hypothetical protein
MLHLPAANSKRWWLLSSANMNTDHINQFWDATFAVEIHQFLEKSNIL